MVMEYPVFMVDLEVRAEGRNRILSALFPYNRTATVASGGRVRKERFSSGSLSWQVREFEKLQVEAAKVIQSGIDEALQAKRLEAIEDALEKRNTFMLVGHDYNRAIADMRSGNLAVQHTDDAVTLRATLPPEGEAPTWIEDAVKGIRGGQVRGVSPGFNVPAKGGERLEREVGGPSMIRVIDDAVAWEYSLVARPAYSGTTVNARADALADFPRRRRQWL